MTSAHVIDSLQYANWSEKVFRQMREGRVDAVHVTVAYHENFRETARNLADWNRHFARHSDLIMPGRVGDDVRRAAAAGKTAIFFGCQNASPIEDDIGLVEICHSLGVRFMQLTYNNQSLLAGGCYEEEDTGVTRFGREAIAEMNRVGMVIDMSHSGERSTMQAMELSSRPIAITHANPAWWRPAPRAKSDAALSALAKSGGMLGFSLYPHHLKGGAQCALGDFCDMVARVAERHGPAFLGIGSDLCQDQPDEVVAWMRDGRWRNPPDGEDPPAFPPQPAWFVDNRDFPALAKGLRRAGFADEEVAGIMGENWLRFFDHSFAAAAPNRDG